jgi:predicted regulator of Ras-like GTPase activity (Roadblock/LC7/MglB family)
VSRVLVPVTDLAPQKASLTTALTGANNDLVFTAKVAGPGGNSITVSYVVSGLNTALSVSVAGFAITVTVATDGAGNPTSTASQVLAAIQGNQDAAALVTAALAPSNDGSGIVTALAATALSGGSLGVSQPAQVNADATNKHYLTGNDGQVVLEVVSTDAASQTVTVQLAPGAAGGVAAVPGQTETVPAGATRILGPFAKSRFDQNAAGDVHFDPSVSTTLKFRAYRVAKAV